MIPAGAPVVNQMIPKKDLTSIDTWVSHCIVSIQGSNHAQLADIVVDKAAFGVFPIRMAGSM
jgi:hypothetical protein